MQTMSLYNTGSKIDTRNTGTDFTRKEGNREMKYLPIFLTGILAWILYILLGVK